MKRKLSLFLFLTFLSNNSISQSHDNVLFIGNSLTYYNDMPNIFKDISNNKGKNVSVTVHAPGGTGFANHVVDNSLYSIIQNDVFDIVVMQPGTSESGGASYPMTTTAANGQILMDSIKKYSPCARFFLYEISNGVSAANNYQLYFTTQARIKDSLSLLADLMHVPMIPAGECFRMHYTASEDLLLHSSYGDVHPNLNGSYLVASAAYTAIYQDSVSGTTEFATLTNTIAQDFQSLADQVVLINLSDWRINTYNPHADYSFVSNDPAIDFTNESVNYDALSWDFGDGNSSTTENPTHSYSSNGIYTMTLTIFKDGCEFTNVQVIEIETVGIDELQSENEMVLYPNPANGIVFFSSNKDIEKAVVMDLNGHVVLNENMVNSSFRFDVSTLPNGAYFVEMIYSDGTNGKKLKLVKL